MTALRVLSTPELFNLMVEPDDDDRHEHKRTLLSMAMTSQSLKEVALDGLWSNLDSVIPLVMMLCMGRMKYLQVDKNEFMWALPDDGISHEGWISFMNYHHRVRRIRISPETSFIHLRKPPTTLVPSVLTTITRTKPFSNPLLPNVRSVFIYSSTHDAFLNCLPFLEESVQHLSLRITTSASQANLTSYELRETASRLPHLQTLCLHISQDVMDFEADLVDVLKGFRSGIKELKLPSNMLTTNVLSQLSQVGSLQKISIYNNKHKDSVITTTSVSTLQPNSFSQVVKLDMAIPLDILTTLMTYTNCLPMLAELKIRPPWASITEIGEFLQSIAGYRPHITSLHLDVFSSSPSQAPPIAFEVLVPLLECRKITAFTLRHQSAVHMGLDDLKKILLHWPELTKLMITVRPPTDESTPALPMVEALSLFAQLCRNIEKIGLFFDPSTSSLPWPPKLPLRLERLKVLHVGRKRPKRPEDIAAFLAGLCNCRMEIVEKFNLLLGDADDWDEGWHEVERHFVAQARQRERVDARLRERQCALNPGWTAVGNEAL